MNPLNQPVLAFSPEPHHAAQHVLTLDQFLHLLKEEEDYYPGEQEATNLMITRLRKIFYDQWGWNSELIRACAHVESRYQTTIVDAPSLASVPIQHTKAVRRYRQNQNQPMHRLVTYRANDRVYGDSRVGQVPEIYKYDHQEVVLPDGTYCDVAHVLAGLDALNHRQIISPLPNFLSFLDSLVPHVDSSVDVVTWLGDIASSSGDFLFCYLKNNRHALSVNQEQKFIDLDAPGSDMLGDIDAYVVHHHYNVAAVKGQRVTQILGSYYGSEEPGSTYRQHRFTTFCAAVGLKSWDGEQFANEQQWITYYTQQLKNNVCFQVFSLTEETVKSIWLPLRIWFNGYPEVLKLSVLLQLFLDALKTLIKTEDRPTAPTLTV